MCWSFRVQGWIALKNLPHIQKLVSTRQPMMEAKRRSNSKLTARVQRDMLYPVRTEGVCVLFLRIHGLETRRRKSETQQVCGRENRRQGNRWDEYGESSSAASSEAQIVSEQVSMDSNWGPWPPSEPANRDKRSAQPYRFQKANKGDGQWSRWASDRSRINGAVVLPDGIRLPAASAHGIKSHQSGRDQSGLHRL